MSDQTDFKPATAIRRGIAILTVANQVIEDEIDLATFGRFAIELQEDIKSNDPLYGVWPLAYVALRIASMLATATGQDIPTVLGFLGAEAAALPEDD